MSSPMVLAILLCVLASATSILASPLIYDGRTPFNYTETHLDGSVDPFLTVVKGSENASHYTRLLGVAVPPTPLWNRRLFPLFPFPTVPIEQALAVSIDNSSVFVPGGNPQYGFRRMDIIAQKNWSPANLLPEMETGTTVFHFSIKLDEKKPLNYNHEYQIVFIEPNDGSHVFGIQLGSPFSNPTGKLPAKNARYFKVLDHALGVLFSTPFTPLSWHNFAVQVDWDNNTLAVLYSKDSDPLQPVTKATPNPTHSTGPIGQGDLHFGVLKLPLVNPKDSPAQQGDVVHYGLQEGSTEGLLYSGIFVEGVHGGISIGGGRSIKPIGKP